MDVAKNLLTLYDTIPAHVKIIAVSKTMPAETVVEAYNAGHRLFGENKAQEMLAKQPLLPADIQWHFIGHLQSNKVKYIVPFVEMIHSVDSLRLLQEIDKQAEKCGRVIKCLLQFHIATEETKFGLDLTEAEEILNSNDYKKLKNITVCGVMGMASFSDDEKLVRQEFHGLAETKNYLNSRYFSDSPGFCEISMGMTGDYQIAIEEGSTMVRIGTAIFGHR